MGNNWLSELEAYAKKAVGSIAKEATERAMYRVQRDFHTKPIQAIASATGHDTLAQACYCMLTTSGSDIEVDIYYDPSFVVGFFNSNSSYHQSGGKWRSVRKNYNLSRYDFWEMHEAGETGGSYGSVDEDWIMKNFWNGVQYSTNGWPLSDAEYLQVFRGKTVSAYDVAKSYIDNYISEGHYGRYIQEEMNNLSK